MFCRVRWGVQRVAVVDIDVHFGNGTAEIFKGDPNPFFDAVQKFYWEDKRGSSAEDPDDEGSDSQGFFPARLGSTVIQDNYVSVGIYPELRSKSKRKRATDPEEVPAVSTITHDTSLQPGPLRGPAGYRRALETLVLPRMEAFRPQLLIISGTCHPLWWFRSDLSSDYFAYCSWF
jgi:acetoin utilization deacetylase AcuC-like enzyme